MYRSLVQQEIKCDLNIFVGFWDTTMQNIDFSKIAM